MAKVTIREVTVREETFNLRFEFDFTLLGQPSAETYTMTISKPKYLFWKESNPVGTILDFIEAMVKPHYEALKKQNALAAQMSLVDKELTW